MTTGCSARLVIAFLAALVTTCSKSKTPAANADAGTDAGPMTSLGRVAAIVIPNCAVAGCHDAVSKTHAMDLSTPAKIYDSWVGVPGFDHCTGMNTPRVLANHPADSLVMMKIEGNAVCAQSQRMPLPPRAELTAEQISVIREWIASGAPPDDFPPLDGGPSDGGPSDGGRPVSDGGWPLCTTDQPCDPGFACSGTSCGGEWECLTHYDETNAHPCSEEIIKFCGCDGNTFEASSTCPDRPWLHVGACDDGVSCTEGMVECSESPPECASGEFPSVVGTCWGPCAPLDSCRCLYHWMCPDLARNTCLMETYRCGPNPNLADAGAPDSGAP